MNSQLKQTQRSLQAKTFRKGNTGNSTIEHVVAVDSLCTILHKLQVWEFFSDCEHNVRIVIQDVLLMLTRHGNNLMLIHPHPNLSCGRSSIRGVMIYVCFF